MKKFNRFMVAIIFVVAMICIVAELSTARKIKQVENNIELIFQLEMKNNKIKWLLENATTGETKENR